MPLRLRAICDDKVGKEVDVNMLSSYKEMDEFKSCVCRSMFDCVKMFDALVLWGF